MSAVLPDSPPLDMPGEDPEALADAVAAVSAAAFQLGVLGAHLAGPVATAPGWLGDDAAAAVAQVRAVAVVARSAHEALGTASDRLSRHADRVADVRRAVAVLRREQHEDRAGAAARPADLALHPPASTSGLHPPVIVALGDELRAADAARVRRHGALLAELHADAVDTARALTAAATAVGGTGRPGDGARVLATLAARLPGWGDGELSARGAELARMLLGPGTPQEMEARARAVLPYAASAAFADALLRALGSGGVRTLLRLLPTAGLDGTAATARVLALAFGGARRSGAVVDPVGEVLDATYVRERAPGIDDDLVALGLATVLVAAVPSGPGTIPATIVAGWGTQVLRREQAWRSVTPAAARARDRAGPMHASSPDPVREVIRFLAGAGDPSAAAAVLSDRPSWDLVLGRPELAVTDPADLRRFVELIGALPGTAGDAAIRAGLDAVGAGLTGDDPTHWQVPRSMLDTLSFPLGSALAQHPDVVSGVLLSAADGTAPSVTDRAALRALGYVSLDPGAASVLDASIAGWAREHAQALGATSLPVAPLAVGAFVAVRQYGQRLAYALHGWDERDAAKAAETFWHWTAGLLLNVVLPRWYGDLGGMAEPFLAHALGYDGTWDNGRDTGLAFDRDDAAAVAEVELGSSSGPPAGQFEAAAATAFGRTGRVLGLPLPPESPEWSWLQAVLDAAPGPDIMHEYFTKELERLERSAD